MRDGFTITIVTIQPLAKLFIGALFACWCHFHKLALRRDRITSYMKHILIEKRNTYRLGLYSERLSVSILRNEENRSANSPVLRFANASKASLLEHECHSN